MIEDGEEQMHKAFTPSSYYQLAFQAGWGCHGDGRPSWLGVLLTQQRSRSVTSDSECGKALLESVWFEHI